MKISLAMLVIGFFVYTVIFVFIICAMLISEEISNEEERKKK